MAGFGDTLGCCAVPSGSLAKYGCAAEPWPKEIDTAFESLSDDPAVVSRKNAHPAFFAFQDKADLKNPQRAGAQFGWINIDVIDRLYNVDAKMLVIKRYDRHSSRFRHAAPSITFTTLYVYPRSDSDFAEE